MYMVLSKYPRFLILILLPAKYKESRILSQYDMKLDILVKNIFYHQQLGTIRQFWVVNTNSCQVCHLVLSNLLLPDSLAYFVLNSEGFFLHQLSSGIGVPATNQRSEKFISKLKKSQVVIELVVFCYRNCSDLL